MSLYLYGINMSFKLTENRKNRNFRSGASTSSRRLTLGLVDTSVCILYNVGINNII